MSDQTESQEERGLRRNSNDQKLGAFVTNKWLVGTLVLLVMSMGGYIFKNNDKTSDAQAAQIQALDRRMGAAEIQAGRTEVQFNDIIRRLDRIENAIYSSPSPSPFRRSGQFVPVPSGKPVAP